MLTKEQEKFIDQHVDSKYYSISRLKRYLSVHTIVGNEVFGYCDRRLRYGDRPTYAEELDDSRGFEPVSVNVFVRRIDMDGTLAKFYADRYCLKRALAGVPGFYAGLQPYSGMVGALKMLIETQDL